MRDFFISYTGIDKPHAVWIAWKLEEAGYTTVIQDWDIRGNFVLAMDDAIRHTSRTVVVLSDAYQRSDHAAVEWGLRRGAILVGCRICWCCFASMTASRPAGSRR